MPDILTALDRLRQQRWYSGQIAGIEPLPSRAPTYAEPDPPLPKPLASLVEQLGIPKLYSHQVELLRHARARRNVIITTATASGKTLAFNLPVFETMLESRSATALYLYPMKAVTQDQLKVLKRFEQGLELELHPAVYDGDTPADKRPRIRQRSRLVLSNPYELHQILPYHYQWQQFYRNLRYCIVDEAHTYRGVFGSNVAQLIRRLRRICAYHGSDPQFFLASASIANPQELAEKLTGKEFVHVGDDGAPRGRTYLVFWNPLANAESSIHVQTQQLVAHFAKSGFQTVCFVPSRRLAELISRWVKEHTPELAVSPYRAGYVPEDRRSIEAGLSSGALRGVVSTDALELGIDIGSLDCIVIAGFPGSFASFWQQAGRAGRKLQDSLVVFIGYADALNQYLLRNPALILERGFEAAVIDLANPYIIKGHLACAASELPLRKEEVDDAKQPAVKALEDELALRRTPVGWIYAGRSRPDGGIACPPGSICPCGRRLPVLAHATQDRRPLDGHVSGHCQHGPHSSVGRRLSDTGTVPYSPPAGPEVPVGSSQPRCFPVAHVWRGTDPHQPGILAGLPAHPARTGHHRPGLSGPHLRVGPHHPAGPVRRLFLQLHLHHQ